MSEEKFPASFLIHNTAKIDSVHWSKHELFEKLQVLLFSFLAGTLLPLPLRAMLTGKDSLMKHLSCAPHLERLVVSPISVSNTPAPR